MFYQRIIRPFFFLLPPERIHELLLHILGWVLRCPVLSRVLRLRYFYREPELRRELFGLTFENLVGLAAGFDKGAVLADRVRSLGFGFTEIGTVTPVPQAGNPRPRLFRLPQDRAIINRMGFNSEGVARVVGRLARRTAYRIPVGGNIGRNTSTPNAKAVQDYVTCFHEMYGLVDFFVVNISCPNISNLAELQCDQGVVPIIEALTSARQSQSSYRPILLKLGPDTTDQSLVLLAETALKHGIDGFVMSNTTQRREKLRTPESRLEEIGPGGLSGTPLLEIALAKVRTLRKAVGRGIPIIGVGGIQTGAEALRMLQAGASLIEIYTGFIYQGPGAARNINRFLLAHHGEIPRW